MTARRIPICKRVCETFSLSANKAEPCGCRRAAASHDCVLCLFILPHRLRQGEALASFSRRLSLEGAGKAQSRCMFSCYFSGSGKDSAARPRHPGPSATRPYSFFAFTPSDLRASNKECSLSSVAKQNRSEIDATRPACDEPRDRHRTRLTSRH